MHGVLLDTSAANPPMNMGVLALGALTVIYIAFVRPLKRGKKKDPLTRGPSDAALAQQRAVERDMTALLVEYEQVIRTMSAQLETRVAKLDLLIRDADERIAAFRSAAAANAGPESGPAAGGPVIPRAGASAIDRHPPAALPAKPDDSGAGFEVPPEPPTFVTDEPPRHADVYALADQGLADRQIAQKLDRAYGEIELILALRPKADAVAVPADGDSSGGGDANVRTAQVGGSGDDDDCDPDADAGRTAAADEASLLVPDRPLTRATAKGGKPYRRPGTNQPARAGL